MSKKNATEAILMRWDHDIWLPPEPTEAKPSTGVSRRLNILRAELEGSLQGKDGQPVRISKLTWWAKPEWMQSGNVLGQRNQAGVADHLRSILERKGFTGVEVEQSLVPGNATDNLKFEVRVEIVDCATLPAEPLNLEPERSYAERVTNPVRLGL